MSVSLILQILLALFKAVPALKNMWERLLVMYIERQQAMLKEELRLAIYNAINQKDQRGIEEVIRNPNAGKPVEIPDSQIVDSLPGVTPHPPRK
jgi:hypothetical protein